MKEDWFLLAIAPPPPPCFVLDVSSSAQPHWLEMKRLVLLLLQSLPPDCLPTLYFLGSAQPYAAKDFARHGERWYQANAGRGSFVAPIFERLSPTEPPPVVLLGNGPLFDLGDWRGTPLADGAVYVRLGDKSLTEGAYPEVRPGVESLKRRLCNPEVRVEISAPGAMPFFWDNPAYRWEKDRLVAVEAKNWAVHMGLLAAEAVPVSAVGVRDNGDTRALSLSAAGAASETAWRDFSSEEDRVLRESLRQGKYRCPCCQAIHPARQFHCPSGSVYPLLEELPRGGFILLETEGWLARFRHHASGALRIDEEAVAVRRDDGVDILRFNAAAGLWQARGERLEGLYQLGEKHYAMVF